MPSIGIRELHNRTTEVLREVWEGGAEYLVTYQGHPVALLVPVDTERLEQAMLDAGREAVETAWERFADLVARAREEWPSGQRSDSVLDEMRR